MPKKNFLLTGARAPLNTPLKPSLIYGVAILQIGHLSTSNVKALMANKLYKYN